MVLAVMLAVIPAELPQKPLLPVPLLNLPLPQVVQRKESFGCSRPLGAVSVTDALTLGVENLQKSQPRAVIKQQVTFVDAAVKGFDFTQASDLIDAGVEEVEALENLTVGSDLDTTILNVLSDENLQL